MRRGACAVAAAVLVATATAGGASDPVARLERALAGTRDLSASFVQARRSPLLPKPEWARGHLYLKRPGSARLEYETPEALVLLKRGDSAWVYVPSLDQVQVTGAGAAGVPIGWALGSSVAELRRSATLRRLGDEVEIRPRSDAGLPWKSLRVGFGIAGDFPVRFVLQDASGEEVELRLTKVARNRGVPASRFEPRWPAGTRVVEMGI